MRIPAATVGKSSCVHLRKTDNNRAKATQCSESVQSVHGSARAREAREVNVRHCSLLRPPQRPRRLHARPDACRQPPAPHSGNRTRSDGRAQRPSRRLTLRWSPPLADETPLPILEVGWSYGNVLHIRTCPHTPTRARLGGEPGFLGGRASCPPKVFPWCSRRGRDALAPRFAVRTPPYSPTRARARRAWDVQAPSSGWGALESRFQPHRPPTRSYPLATPECDRRRNPKASLQRMAANAAALALVAGELQFAAVAAPWASTARNDPGRRTPSGAATANVRP